MTRKPYKTDLSDEQWLLLQPLIPPAKHGGRPRSVDMREVINAIMYVLHTGIQWEMMPHDLPPYTTVYTYFDQWSKDGYWEVINAALVAKVRKQAGRDEQPSAAIVDSQSVKTAEKGGLVLASMVIKRSKAASAT